MITEDIIVKLLDHAGGSMSTAVAAALSMINSVAFGDPDGPPLPADFVLPGVVFNRVAKSLGATVEQRFDILKLFFDDAEDRELEPETMDLPGFLAQAFPEEFEDLQVITDPAPSPVVTPSWEDTAPPVETTPEPLLVSFSIDRLDFETAMSGITGPTPIEEHSPWMVTFPLNDEMEFSLEVRGDETGEGYVDALITDPSRQVVYVDFAIRDTIFGKWAANADGQEIHITVNASAPVAVATLA